MCLKSGAGYQIADVFGPQKITNIALDLGSARDCSDSDYWSVWVHADGQKTLLASLTRQKHHVQIDIEFESHQMIFSLESSNPRSEVYLSGYRLKTI